MMIRFKKQDKAERRKRAIDEIIKRLEAYDNDALFHINHINSFEPYLLITENNRIADDTLLYVKQISALVSSENRQLIIKRIKGKLTYVIY